MCTGLHALEVWKETSNPWKYFLEKKKKKDFFIWLKVTVGRLMEGKFLGSYFSGIKSN